MTAIRKIGPARLGPRDWERAAVAAFIEGGIEAVTIPRLATALGVTKGSFYWHFKGLDALLTAALERWEHAYTDFGMEAFTLVSDPRDRLRPWFTEAGTEHEAQRLHLAVARAAHHPVIRPIFARVTEKRIDYIARSLTALKIPKAEARRRAAILHTFYMGVLMMADAAPEALGDRTVRSALSATSFDLLTAV